MVEFDEQGRLVGPKPEVRYIKLGRNNAWAARAFRDGEIPFSFREIPHDLALTADEERMMGRMMEFGKTAGVARNATRQVLAFYGLDDQAIWITFADGRMWWATAEPEVMWIGESEDYAPRIRRTRQGWKSADSAGAPYEISTLSSRLTKVMSTQATLCRVDAEDYALRRIFSVEEPVIVNARLAKQTVIDAITDLVGNLHWSDFETLIDLLLARSGWHRVSGLGGSMKDADIIAEQVVTNELAFIQVKSASSQAEFDRYVAKFDKNPGWSRMIFACHSPAGTLSSSRPEVMVWARSELAQMVFRQGLFDWLVERAG